MLRRYQGFCCSSRFLDEEIVDWTLPPQSSVQGVAWHSATCFRHIYICITILYVYTIHFMYSSMLSIFISLFAWYGDFQPSEDRVLINLHFQLHQQPWT